MAGPWLAACSPRPPLPNDAYVWQRQWTPALSDAMRQSADVVSRWRVLAGEWEAPSGQSARWRFSEPDWRALVQTRRPVIAVFRLDGQRPEWDAAAVSAAIAQRLDLWRVRGVNVAGVEIDHDCATARLPAYAAFLRQLRPRLPADAKLSITVLPAWLNSPALDVLLSLPDESVLQVHAVMQPGKGLFDPTRAQDWARAYARRTQRPWRIALPAYGSRVVWTSSGRIAAVESEQPLLTGDAMASELVAPPAQVQDFVNIVEAAPPPGLAGLAWFRLPSRDDRRAWSLRAWHAVLARQPLRSELKLTAAPVSAGLYDLWLSNSGNADAALPAALRWPSACQAADGAGGYLLDYDATGMLLRRAQPGLLPPSAKRRVGWLRCPALNPKKDLHVQA
ncbi:DUF3142 domain-containing protein [Chromobacterium paludis]|uniref:DUF3142 domain-containing protein n=1 Tax=Chromobacterium paludis TaxID=2605945 RepID=A0A5C1DEJ1_9NEIS|nr:DUF3142 domain-containing protein [Chromobacterium paludis]QEL55170.1 DUF3142 domain-containing protein [Chromobacterium paludis]